jgi:glycosyltransferase involved in cell wall biosynthesis
MKILFVYPNMYVMGGIQTWLARMLPRLEAAGHEVALLTRPSGEDWDATSQFVDAVGAHAPVHLAGRHWFDLRRLRAARPEPADVVFSCNLHSLLTGVLVQQHLMPGARLVAGVFHPREYSWKRSWGPRRRWVQHLGERVLEGLPAPNFVFFSPATEAHPAAEFLGRDLSAASNVPIPIDTDRFHDEPDRGVQPGKIVSIARLAPYYTYIRHTIRVVADLRAAGHGFTYHCYGDGEERESLEAEVRERGLEDAVFLHPPVPYDRFEEVVEDASAFIGIGTSLLEAAACGVPALVAIDSNRQPTTQGWLSETEGNHIGGHVEGHPEYPIADRLLSLEDASEEEYRTLAAACRRRAEEFSLPQVLPSFTAALHAAEPYAPNISGAERAIGRTDWVLEAVMLKLGARDATLERYSRPAPEA